MNLWTVTTFSNLSNWHVLELPLLTISHWFAVKVRTDMVAQKDGLSLSMFIASPCANTNPKPNYKYYQGVNLTQEYICTLWLWTHSDDPDDNLPQFKVILFEKCQSSFMGLCETAHTSAPSIGNPLYDTVTDEQQLSNLSCKPSDFHLTLLPMQQSVWVILCLYGSAKHLFSLCPSKPVEVDKHRLFCPSLLTHVLEYYIVLPNLYS